MRTKSLVLFSLSFFMISLFILGEVPADIIYLKNGMQMEGLIKSETDTEINLDLGFGKTRIKKNTIKSIQRSDTKEKEKILGEWEQKEKKREEKKELRGRQKIENVHSQIRQKKQRNFTRTPKQTFVKYIKAKNSIGVNALLDGKVSAEFLVDTGATSILLSADIARKLGISPLHGRIVHMQVADGRVVKSLQVYLKSVSVDGMEVRDVAANVLLSDQGLNNWDGLLGMSYLKHFIFSIDAEKQQILLEQKIEQ